jgi:hypothetical protein
MSQSAAFSFSPPTDEAIEHIAANMRELDAAEIMASHGHEPLDALKIGKSVSDYSAIVHYKDIPCAMFGLNKGDILSCTGIPWMLGTHDVSKDVRGFLSESKAILNEMLDLAPRLFNYVHAENKPSIVYLKHLGFTIDKPKSYGVKKELFHRFSLEKKDV